MTRGRTAARLGIGLRLASWPPPAGRAADPPAPAPAPRRGPLCQERAGHRLPAAGAAEPAGRPGHPRVLQADRDHQPAVPDRPGHPVAPARHRRRQAVPGRGHPAPGDQDRHLERPAGADAHPPVRRLLRRAHPGGRARLVRPGRRRLGLVLRRGRLQLRGRRRRRHRRHLAGRQGRPAGHDHARRPQAPDGCTGPRTSPSWSSRR